MFNEKSQLAAVVVLLMLVIVALYQLPNSHNEPSSDLDNDVVYEIK